MAIFSRPAAFGPYITLYNYIVAEGPPARFDELAARTGPRRGAAYQFKLLVNISLFIEMVVRPGGVRPIVLRHNPRPGPLRHHQQLPHQLWLQLGTALQRQGRAGEPPRSGILQVRK